MNHLFPNIEYCENWNDAELLVTSVLYMVELKQDDNSTKEYASLLTKLVGYYRLISYSFNETMIWANKA
jgi:hypothetical protein